MIWLSLHQLKDLGVSKGILHRNRADWKWRGTGTRGRNGKEMEEVLLESMQKSWQDEYLRKSRESGVGSRESEEQAGRMPAVQLEGSLTIETEEEEPTEVGTLNSERRLMEALVRYAPDVRDAFLGEATRLSSIVERFEAVSPKRLTSSKFQVPGSKLSREFVPEVVKLAAETACVDPVVLSREPSRAKAKSPHTLEMWAKAYRTDGLAVFLRKPPTASGAIDRRKAEISAGAAEWVNKQWTTYPSATHLYKDLVKLARKNRWTIPARGYFWRLYKKLPKIVATLAFEGQKAYTGKYAPYVPRDYRDLAALQVLCGDHSVRDVTVMLPDGSLTRPWLTLWQDLRTGLLWGWHLDLTPSSITIGLAYADGVKNFGAQPLSNPDADFYSYLYTDQGKDYRSKTLTGETLVFKNAARIEGGLNVLCTQRRVGFMDELGIKHLMARGYNAREKMVERTHKDISAWEQNTFEHEYCGRGIGHKPERWKAAWARHQKLLKKIGTRNLDWLVQESPFMMLDDYREAVGGWINEYNHSEHTRAVLGGATVVPVAEYERLYTTRLDIAEDALALLLMKADRRTIGKNGVQFFQSNWQFMHEAMSEFKGQDVEIRYTDGDWERLYVVLPATQTKPSQVVEALAVGNSGVLNKNKKTMGLVAKQRAHEMKTFRDHQLIQQSNWRGETAEDRVAMELINPDDAMPPEQQKIAVNAGPSVQVFNRFGGAKLSGTPRPAVTAEQIESANVIDGMFGGDRPAARIKEEWED